MVVFAAARRLPPTRAAAAMRNPVGLGHSLSCAVVPPPHSSLLAYAQMCSLSVRRLFFVVLASSMTCVYATVFTVCSKIKPCTINTWCAGGGQRTLRTHLHPGLLLRRWASTRGQLLCSVDQSALGMAHHLCQLHSLLDPVRRAFQPSAPRSGWPVLKSVIRRLTTAALARSSGTCG